MRRLYRDWTMLSFVKRCFEIPIPDAPGKHAWITSDYGWRQGQGNEDKGCPPECREWHWGTDIQWGGKGNAPDHPMRKAIVVAPFGGRVLEVDHKYGKVTIVDSNGRFVIFRHLEKIRVIEGQMVRKSGRLGNVGNKATGPVHLHFEVGFIVGNRFRIWAPREWILASDKYGYPDFSSWLDTTLMNLFKRKECVCPEEPELGQMQRPRDPLIINLDGNGIQTVGLEAGVHFDHDGNGFGELTGSVARGNGFLVVDRNGSGYPDSGNELFGDFTPLASGILAANGFEALRQYDTNADGKIDAQDPVWSQLRVWQDEEWYGEPINGDPDASGNMSTLDELGISAIFLDSTISNKTDEAGNTEIRTGHFEWSDGRIGTIAEYRLQRDFMDTVETEFLEVPLEISFSLPDLYGFGNVRSLHQALVRDGSGQLKSLVEQFINATDPGSRETLMRQILVRWTESHHAFYPRYVDFDEHQLRVLEKFYGERFHWLGAFSMRISDTLWALQDAVVVSLNDAYRALFEMYYAELMAQTHLSDLYAKVRIRGMKRSRKARRTSPA